MRSVWLVIMAASVSGACLGCKARHEAPSSVPAAPSASSAASAASAAGPEPIDPPRRQLAERAPIDAPALKTKRTAVLAALAQGRQEIAAHRASEALSTLVAARASDPDGALLGAALIDAARAAKDSDALTRYGGAAAATALAEPVADLTAACTKLESVVRQGPSPAAVHCETEYTLDLKDAELRRASALRLTAEETSGDLHSRRVVGWVALETPKGVLLYGPIAEAVSPLSPELTNDFVVDLQKVDVLPGKSPEVVVKVNELVTRADLAANEIVQATDARAFLLSIDRGKVEASRGFVLESRSVRDAIDAKDLRTAPGYKKPADLGKVTAYRMKVAWGGPNVIILSKAEGNGTPKDDGELQLFP